MALVRNHDKIERLRLTITDRIALHLLPITANDEMADELDSAARAQWAEKRGAIPYDKGDLEEILTASKHSHRVLRISSNRVSIAIKHNGYAFNRGVKARVDALLDRRRLVKDATDALRRKHYGRRRGKSRR